MKVATFNVLADAYTGYGDYTYVEPGLLAPGVRIAGITQLLRTIDADVIGLQEAEEPLVTALDGIHEWQSFWSPKGRNKPDGCLMLVKNDIPVSDFQTHEYGDGSGHVMQSIQIGSTVFANTHIKWAPADSADHIGVRQAQELVDHIGPSKNAVIFADCNDRPNGPVRRIIEDAGFTNVGGDIPTALVDQKPVALDLLAIRGVRGRYISQNYDISRIPNTDCPSDHMPLEAELDLRNEIERER